MVSPGAARALFFVPLLASLKQRMKIYKNRNKKKEKRTANYEVPRCLSRSFDGLGLLFFANLVQTTNFSII
jgi:predicted glycosyltransferase